MSRPSQQHLTAVRRHQPVHAPQQRALPGARRREQRRDEPGGDGERHAAQHLAPAARQVQGSCLEPPAVHVRQRTDREGHLASVRVSAENPEEAVRDQPRLPWEGTPRRVDILCWGGITLSGIYALALLPLVPSLLGTNPVLLEFLRGSTTSMVTAGAFARVGEASLALAILAPFPIMLLWDPLFWWAGRLWGRPVIDLFAGERPRARRWVNKIERNADKIGPPAVVFAYVIPIPSPLIYAAAGWTGMRLRTFLILDLDRHGDVGRAERRPRLRDRPERGRRRQGDLPLRPDPDRGARRGRRGRAGAALDEASEARVTDPRGAT